MLLFNLLWPARQSSTFFPILQQDLACSKALASLHPGGCPAALPKGAPTLVATAASTRSAGPSAAPEASGRSPAKRGPGLCAALAALRSLLQGAAGLRRGGPRRPAAPSTCGATAGWLAAGWGASWPLPQPPRPHLPPRLSRCSRAPPNDSPVSPRRPESRLGPAASDRPDRLRRPPPAAAPACQRSAAGPAARSGTRPPAVERGPGH